MCLEPAGDVAVTHTIRDRFRLENGHLVLSPGPDTGGAEDLMRDALVHLNVLWRLPTRLQRSRAPITSDDRAVAEWEISWALTGITDLWVLNANVATAPPGAGCATPPNANTYG